MDQNIIKLEYIYTMLNLPLYTSITANSENIFKVMKTIKNQQY